MIPIQNESRYSSLPAYKVWESYLTEKVFKLKYLENLCPYFTKYGGCNNQHNEYVPSLCTPQKCPHAFCMTCEKEEGCKLKKGKLDTCKDYIEGGLNNED